MLHLEPSARKIFKFTADEDIRLNPSFRIHSRAMVTMIDSAVDLLGPDLDLLQEDLFRLGTRHIGYGVKVEYLPIMGKAVDYTLDTLLKEEEYTKKHKKAWKMIMKYMVTQMSLGMQAAIHKLTIDVTSSWNELKRIPNHKEIAGTLIYSKLFELIPESKPLFMKMSDDDSSCDSFIVDSSSSQDMIQLHHSRAVVYMIDKAVGMLGPDLEPLTVALVQLGRRHVAYGVESHYLPYMGKALDHALSVVLGGKYTKRDKESWEIVIDFMVSTMTVGMIE